MTLKKHILMIAVVAVATMLLCGCANPRRDAIETLQAQVQARSLAVDNAQELYRQAEEAYQAGALEQAIRLAQESLAQNGRDARPWMLLGMVQFQRDHYNEAAASFRKAERLEPTRPEPSYNLGMVLEAVCNYDKAASQYELALARDPGNILVKENLARCLIRLGRTAQAMPLLREVRSQERRPEWRRWIDDQLAAFDAP